MRDGATRKQNEYPGTPSSASTCRVIRAAAAAARVSASAPSASDAASWGVNGGVSLVLTRPGRGSFAMTISWAATASGCVPRGLAASNQLMRRTRPALAACRARP